MNTKPPITNPTFVGTVYTPELTTTGLITTAGGINFNSGTVTNNVITNPYQMKFDGSYGMEKIIGLF